MIALKNITKKYHKTVLEHVNLEFQAGRIYAIKGVSGCGKTTLLNILAGLDTDYEGEYLYDGASVSNMNRGQLGTYKKRIGYICQQSLLIGTMTIRENLEFIACGNENITYYAKLFGIEELLERFPEQLSGGQRQRAAIVRTLLQNPDIIVADEPTSALDYENSIALAKEIEKIRGMGKIVIIATHKDVFDEIADEVVMLDYGMVSCIQKNNNQADEKVFQSAKNENDSKRKNSLPYDIKYIKRKAKFRNVCAMVVLFALIFVFVFGVFSVEKYIKREYIRRTNREFHYNVIKTDAYSAEKICSIMNAKVYPFHDIWEEDLRVCALFEKEDSAFGEGYGLAWGHYPSEENQVLVSERYAEELGIGQEEEYVLEVRGRKYQVSGVIKDEEEDTSNRFWISEFQYYDGVNKSNYVFLKESAIQDMETDEERKLAEETQEIQGCVVAVYEDGMYTNPVYENMFTYEFTDNYYTTWKYWIGNHVADANYIADTAFFIMIASGIVLALFMICKISIDLFYRKREIGYLQIFHVGRKRVSFLMAWSYMRIILLSEFIAVVLFTIGTAVYLEWTQYDYRLVAGDWALLLSIITCFSLICTGLPLIKYIKKDPVSLLH